MEYPITFVEQFLSYSLFRSDVIDSTNSYFKREYSHFETDSVLIAKKQTAGRGRYERRWEDDDDLLFSLLKKDDNRYEILLPLSLMRTLRKKEIKAFIKWPNDIYVDSKKLAGILIEDIFQKQERKCQIIGVGINMTDKENVNGIGVNHFVDVDKIAFLKELLKELNLVLSLPFEEALEEYCKNNLIYHREISFCGNNYFVKSFTKEGYLLVTDKNDQEKIIKTDEINIKESLIKS